VDVSQLVIVVVMGGNEEGLQVCKRKNIRSERDTVYGGLLKRKKGRGGRGGGVANL